ncbi:hypothetical protein SynA1562_01920 [Synechococcus sp. A15-62]|nr:hypothetical protein SynA1562_01920 [Synechococcus sp. A15-62]
MTNDQLIHHFKVNSFQPLPSQEGLFLGNDAPRAFPQARRGWHQ